MEITVQEYNKLKEYGRKYDELIRAIRNTQDSCDKNENPDMSDSLIIFSHLNPDEYKECIKSASQISNVINEKARQLN